MASDAGFQGSRIRVGTLEDLEKVYSRLIIHMSSTGNAEKVSAISDQLSVEAIVRTFVAVEKN